MKHWIDQDFSDVAPARLTRRERQRLRAMFAEQPVHRRRRDPVHVGSMIGVALAVAVLVGLVLLLAPADPVSPKLMR